MNYFIVSEEYPALARELREIFKDNDIKIVCERRNGEKNIESKQEPLKILKNCLTN